MEFRTDCSMHVSIRPTQRAPDWWESARFQAVCLAWSWFRQSGVVSSHPPAGNASRWAHGIEEKQNEENSCIVMLFFRDGCL